MASDRIFVQIPAYRDPLLASTLESLFDEAAAPGRLRVRVCWQRARGDKLPAPYRRHPQVEIDEVDFLQSRGANWARQRVQRHWQGEPWSLVIDSHLRFARGWDSYCTGWLQQLRECGVSRPLLTCYPPGFDPKTYPRGRSMAPLKNYKEDYVDGLLVHFAGFALPLWRWLKAPIPAQFLALGFLFTEGRFNEEVPFDPNIYFFGDEITTGLRAYCRGYEFFHPHRVLAWHAYDRNSRTCHWQDHDNWTLRDRRSLRRVRRILRGRDYSGLPTGGKRSVRSYERYIGLPLVLEHGS